MRVYVNTTSTNHESPHIVLVAANKRRLAQGHSDRNSLFINSGQRSAISGAIHMSSDRYDWSGGHASHSSSFDQRRRPETFFTAIATAFFWPTRTTSFLPRVTPV